MFSGLALDTMSPSAAPSLSSLSASTLQGSSVPRIVARRGESEVLKVMKDLFSVSNVRAKYNSANSIRLTVRQRQSQPLLGYLCGQTDDYSGKFESSVNLRKSINKQRNRCADGGNGKEYDYSSSKTVKLKPDFYYLDAPERVLHTRLISNEKGDCISYTFQKVGFLLRVFSSP